MPPEAASSGQRPIVTQPPSLESVASVMAAHQVLYRWRRPIYQWAMLSSLSRAWQRPPKSVLDVGGGTGLMAQVIEDLFTGTQVTLIDVEDRRLDTVSVSSRVYDGTSIPFETGCFDCAILLNVLHHVPAEQRAVLLSECLRVTNGGPLYIKDHLSTGRVDDLRLRVLDAIGNAPFGGMISADYLRRDDWAQLAARAGCSVEEHPGAAYRSGPSAALFPNRLEVMMTWRAAAKT
jgi:SAM-dependent methyltransferase